MYFILFLIEMGILFLFAKSVTYALWKLTYLFTNRQMFGTSLITIIFFPGTLIHELAHLLSAGVLLVPVGELNLVPEIDGKSIRLGSVMIGRTDPIRRTVIGVAPVLVGLGVIFTLILMVNNQTIQLHSWWQFVLFIYAIFVISNTMFSSKKDMEGVVSFVGAIILVLAILTSILYFTNNLHYLQFITRVNFSALDPIFQKVDYYLLAPLLINFSFIFLTKLLTRDF